MRTKPLLAAASAVLAASAVMAMPDGRMAKLDTDDNGTISLAEVNAQAAERFARIDADKDGFVTQAEMKAHHEAMRARWVEHAATQGGSPRPDGEAHHNRSQAGAKHGDHFARLDTDRDGRISLAEFQAGHATRFGRLDTNKDGAVTQDEMAKHREAWKAKRQG
jgi:Ca2+-binding EF-hand superfamily protein